MPHYVSFNYIDLNDRLVYNKASYPVMKRKVATIYLGSLFIFL